MIRLGEITSRIVPDLVRPIEGEIRDLESRGFDLLGQGKEADALNLLVEAERLRESRAQGARFAVKF